MQGAAPERLDIRSAGLDETIDTMRRVFGDVELRPGEQGAPRLALRSIRTEHLAVTRWSMEGVCDGGRSQPEDEPAVLTGVVLRGVARLHAGRTEIDCARPFVYPDHIDSTLCDPDVVNLEISRALVQRHALAMTGVDDLVVRFHAIAPGDPALDRLWRDTTAYASRALDALVQLEDHALALAALDDLVTTTLLRAFPNTALDAERLRDIAGPRHAALRRALQHIDDHLAEPLAIADIAAAARLSIRGLHSAFRNHLDSTPMAYVRRARLAEARRELQDPTGRSTLAEVAARWGFVDERHLIALHRREYGEAPADPAARSGISRP